MLGSAFINNNFFSDFDVAFSVRSKRKSKFNKNFISFDVETSDLNKIFEEEYNYVINCIGVIKPRIEIVNNDSRTKTIKVNSIFPYDLAQFAERKGFKVISIATDCVFSGSKGEYRETDRHDPNDFYGMTKSLGEVNSSNVMNLRTSIIGAELGDNRYSLIEWLLSQKVNSEVSGFKNHFWNGITTKTFATLAGVIIKDNLFDSGTKHIVPLDIVSKYELLVILANKFHRNDIKIVPTQASEFIDRTLVTIDSDFNENLWKLGFGKRLRIEEMCNNLI
jgi:dTDP-4-dehydrorhamnose reductase